jgi:conjugal transfer ATP-binding protein TraC
MERTEAHLRMLGVVEAHDPESGIFRLYPNRIGFGAVCDPLPGGDNSTADKLNLIFSLPWPTGTMLQFTCYTSPDLVRTTQAYQDARENLQDPLLSRVRDEHIDYLTTGAHMPVDASGLKLRDTRVIITAHFPFKGAEVSEQELRKAGELKVGFDQVLQSVGMRAEKLTASRYLRFMETILNQSECSAWRQSPRTPYDETQPICSQVLDPGSSIEVDKNGLWLNGNARVRVLSPKKYPDATYFGHALRYICEPTQGSRGIRDTTIITLNVLMPDQGKARRSIEKSHAWATHQSNTPISKFVRYYRDKKRSLDVLVDRLGDGDRMVKAYLSMAVITQGRDDSEDERRRAEDRSIAASINAQSYWREFGFQMMEDSHIVLPFFSQLLPFASDEGFVTASERYKQMSGLHATHLMPVLGSWRGTGTPFLTLFARDGQVQPISPWDTDNDMNFMICAQTGSGKSVLAQEIELNMRTIGGNCFVIDVGDSYKNLCETLGGLYLEFGADSRICMNPFPLIQDFDEEVATLESIIAIMIAPKAGLDDLRSSIVLERLRKVWDIKGRDMMIEDLRQEFLADEREIVRDMGVQLGVWGVGGAFGKFFNGPNTIDINNPFTVLELGALKEKEHLQRVVLMMLMVQINHAIYHKTDKSKRSMVLIDEAWQLLAGDEMASFIVRAYRQFRKHNASIGVVTQSVLDVWETKGGRAIAENSSHMYLLKQRADSIDAIERDSRLPFGKWGYDMLKTVHTVQGQYSEIMAITPRGVGVGRLILNDFKKGLFSTKAEDVAAIKRLREEQGLSLAEAVMVHMGIDRRTGSRRRAA